MTPANLAGKSGLPESPEQVIKLVPRMRRVALATLLRQKRRRVLRTFGMSGAAEPVFGESISGGLQGVCWDGWFYRAFSPSNTSHNDKKERPEKYEWKRGNWVFKLIEKTEKALLVIFQDLAGQFRGQ